ncbi:hypothetical protein CYY_007393 [Polysphondylium violaceum]|uniref:Ankyrin repeat-containing protein n=1 Tax=Polysphondylium violaceum TaxID=133409 RepID=A0A8J4PQV8_9MYCE|nr:hypothetical protein CYY_007393 [Polysphondylium violaceum]
MIIEHYRSVFCNNYLSKKIFNAVHQIQINRYPLKYNDIVDVGWMLKYSHIGLAREKINNNSILYVNPHDLFEIVANADTQMFITLFEKYKYYSLYYYENNFEEIIFQITNTDVIKYLYQNGYARDLDFIEGIQSLDIKVLSFLLENGWFQPTPTFLVNVDRDKRPDENYTKEFIDLVVKYTPSPIQNQDINVIMGYMNGYRPRFEILDSLLPLFVQDHSILTDKALDFIQKQRNTIKNSSELMLAIKEPGFIFNINSAVEIWVLSIKEGEEVFFKVWEALSSRIKVFSYQVYFHISRDLTKEDNRNDLENDKEVIEISTLVIEEAIKVGSLKILLSFNWDRGILYEFETLEQDLFTMLMGKTLSQYECSILERLWDQDTIQGFKVLYYCCIHGNAKNFDLLYPLFKETLETDDTTQLFTACIDHKNHHMIKVLYSHGIFLSNNKEEFFEMCANGHPFTHLLDDVDRIIADCVTQQELHETFSDLLDIAIHENDFVGIKYIFNKHKFELLEPDVFNLLFNCQNLAIIDFIHKNRSLCFTSSSPLKCINALFGTPNKYFINICLSNPPLIEFLIQEKFLSPKFRDIYINKKKAQCEFHEIVYLIDNNKYSSIDSMVGLLMDSPDCFKCLEYIYRNQDKFQIKPLFQSMFDAIVKLDKKKIQTLRDILKDLVHKYGCVLNDGHRQNLDKYQDGLTLFGIVPDSIFVSNNNHQRPTTNNKESAPKKRQKK